MIKERTTGNKIAAYWIVSLQEFSQSVILLAHFHLNTVNLTCKRDFDGSKLNSDLDEDTTKKKQRRHQHNKPKEVKTKQCRCNETYRNALASDSSWHDANCASEK